MQAKDDDRSQVRAQLSGNTTIGELVGTAGLGGYGFNAVRWNVRFAPRAIDHESPLSRIQIASVL
jgi:hypothetical protein